MQLGLSVWSSIQSRKDRDIDARFSKLGQEMQNHQNCTHYNLKLKDVKRDVRGCKGWFQIPRFDLLGLLCPLGGQANQTEAR